MIFACKELKHYEMSVSSNDDLCIRNSSMVGCEWAAIIIFAPHAWWDVNEQQSLAVMMLVPGTETWCDASEQQSLTIMIFAPYTWWDVSEQQPLAVMMLVPGTHAWWNVSEQQSLTMMISVDQEGTQPWWDVNAEQSQTMEISTIGPDSCMALSILSSLLLSLSSNPTGDALLFLNHIKKKSVNNTFSRLIKFYDPYIIQRSLTA